MFLWVEKHLASLRAEHILSLHNEIARLIELGATRSGGAAIPSTDIPNVEQEIWL